MTPSANSLHHSLPTASGQRDVQIAAIAEHTTVLRSRTWERLKFEVEYNLCRGTTANSYLVQGDRVALLDPPGESFTQIYLQALAPYWAEQDIDYIILSHVNPNRMATLVALVEQMPQVTLVCSRPAAQALTAAFPGWSDRIQTVRPPQTQLDLGQGHELQLFTVPTPRWPDGLCTYDPTTRILFSDKFFGAHVCGDALFDEDWRHLQVDRRYYFDCLQASQVRQVKAFLHQIAPLPLRCIAPGHGPLVRYGLSCLQSDYQLWCQQQAHHTLRVALLYASAYGNTKVIADAIAQGLAQSSVAVELINCEHTDPVDVAKAVETSDGFIIGSPTLGGHAPVQIQTALGTLLASATKTQLAGVFGSYGWSGEAIDLIEAKLRNNNYRFGFDTVRVRFSPDEATLETCQRAGRQFAQQLRKQKKRQAPRQAVTETQANRTEQAVGRIIGSVCVITTCQGDSHSGLLTTNVSQATFDPPGIMVAIEAGHYGQRLLQPEAPFVLNLLQEGRTVRRHFSYHPQPGDNPFTQVAHRPAGNGCLILEEALAYLECRVETWMPCGDCWLVYATVEDGDVLEDKGVTAIHYRKSGSQH